VAVAAVSFAVCAPLCGLLRWRQASGAWAGMTNDQQISDESLLFGSAIRAALHSELLGRDQSAHNFLGIALASARRVALLANRAKPNESAHLLMSAGYLARHFGALDVALQLFTSAVTQWARASDLSPHEQFSAVDAGAAPASHACEGLRAACIENRADLLRAGGEVALAIQTFHHAALAWQQALASLHAEHDDYYLSPHFYALNHKLDHRSQGPLLHYRIYLQAVAARYESGQHRAERKAAAADQKLIP